MTRRLTRKMRYSGVTFDIRSSGNIGRVRASIVFPALGTWVLAGLLSGCSGGPTAPGDGPSTTLQIPTGPQVLRLSPITTCRLPNTVPLVYTAVTVTRVGSEWIAKATSVEAGDVELRIRVTSSNPAATLVSGTIKGTAVHMPDVAPEIFPPGDTRVNFGADGRSTLNGVIFPLTPGGPTGAFDGVGTGALTVRNGSGDSCGGASFSWRVFPQL
jgi:hypothetical protein